MRNSVHASLGGCDGEDSVLRGALPRLRVDGVLLGCVQRSNGGARLTRHGTFHRCAGIVLGRGLRLHLIRSATEGWDCAGQAPMQYYGVTSARPGRMQAAGSGLTPDLQPPPLAWLRLLQRGPHHARLRVATAAAPVACMVAADP